MLDHRRVKDPDGQVVRLSNWRALCTKAKVWQKVLPPLSHHLITDVSIRAWIQTDLPDMILILKSA